MQNTDIVISEKFHNDQLINDRALVLWKSDNSNTKKKKKKNNSSSSSSSKNSVGSAWEPVSEVKKNLDLQPRRFWAYDTNRLGKNVRENLRGDFFTHSVGSVRWAPDHGVSVINHTLSNEADTDDDATEIAQVEDVVRLGGRRQQAGHRLLVHVHDRFHQLFAELHKLLLLFLCLDRHHHNPEQESDFTMKAKIGVGEGDGGQLHPVNLKQQSISRKLNLKLNI